jgi:hypothetical protein
MNPMNQILVQCPRSCTTHMQLTAFSSGIAVEYGKVVHGMSIRFVRIGNKEVLTYSEHPELFEMYDGLGWDVFELWAFVNKMGNIDVEEQSSPEATPA